MLRSQPTRKLTIQTAEKFNRNIERKIKAENFEIEYLFIGLAFSFFTLEKLHKEANLTFKI